MPPLVRLLVTVGGLGLMRPASGTWGSLPPALIAALFVLTGVSAWAWVAVMGGLVAVFSLACVAGGDWAEAEFGKKDPGEVVADETAGMALTLLTFAGLGQGESMTIGRGLMVVAVAFVAFRVMDVIKPPPARGLQGVPGGWGILLDDLAAGAMAAVLTWALVLTGVV